MSIKLSQLRDILAVVETGSLRAAGRQLGIGQPSISRSIREVESDLGISLFQRRTTGVSLTEIGEIFVRRAVAIESELRRAREEVEQFKGRSTGQVSVALSSASGIALMPWILPSFRRRYPKSLLKITESLFQPVEAQIISGSIDFFVGPWDEDLSATSLSVERLFENRRLVVARRGHPLLNATTLAELVDAEWVRPSFTTRYNEADFVAMFERVGLPPPRIVLHSLSAQMTLLVLENSLLLTILPRQWLELPSTAERIQPIHLTESLPAAPVCIVRRGDLPLTPMAEHLCDLVRRAGLDYGLRHADA